MRDAKKKKKAAARRRKVTSSAPIIANRGEELAYERALRKLCKGMVVDSGQAMVKLYKQYNRSIEEGADIAFVAQAISEKIEFELATMWDVYAEKFAAEGKELAAAMVARQTSLALRTARKAASEAMTGAAGAGGGIIPPVGGVEKVIPEVFPPSGGALPPTGASGVGGGAGEIMTIYGDAIPAEVAPTVQAAITENANLIKSIPPQYLDRIAGAVTRSMQSGGSTRALIDEIQRYGQMTLRRARNIARDQVHKAFESINIAEFKRLGIRKFRWMHTGGSTHPREYHLRNAPSGLNNGVFSLDDPPVIDPNTGEKGFPGQLPFCRCTMCAVVEW